MSNVVAPIFVLRVTRTLSCDEGFETKVLGYFDTRERAEIAKADLEGRESHLSGVAEALGVFMCDWESRQPAHGGEKPAGYWQEYERLAKLLGVEEDRYSYYFRVEEAKKLPDCYGISRW